MGGRKFFRALHLQMCYFTTIKKKVTTMNKEKLQRMIRLTQECIVHFWQRDADFMIQYFDKNIVLIGAMCSQYKTGREAVAETFRDAVQQLRACQISHQELSVVLNDRESCAIAGCYTLTTASAAGHYLQSQQRGTFVWKIVDDQPRLTHCHISGPMEDHLRSDSKPATNTTGKLSQRYWTERQNAAPDQARLVLTDVDDVVHFLRPQEIVYVSALGRYCELTTIDGSVLQLRVGIGELRARLDDHFTSVHRSYIVNNLHVKRVQPYEVIMTNDSHIPIPVKRYTAIREQLIAFCKE